jgi:hypothetical protein
MILIKNPDTLTAFSMGDMSNPITTLLNGTDGDTVEIPLLVVSDNEDREYGQVQITIQNPHSRITYQFALDANGVPDTYQDELTIDKITKDGTKIWLRKQVQANTPTELYKDAKIHITAIEYAVE